MVLLKSFKEEHRKVPIGSRVALFRNARTRYNRVRVVRIAAAHRNNRFQHCEKCLHCIALERYNLVGSKARAQHIDSYYTFQFRNRYNVAKSTFIVEYTVAVSHHLYPITVSIVPNIDHEHVTVSGCFTSETEPITRL